MSAFFSTLSCCWFWLLLGVLIGWLLNRWLCKCSHKNNPSPTIYAAKPVSTAAVETPPVAKLADVPASTVVTPASVSPSTVTTTPAVKATPKPAKPAKPKPAAQPTPKTTSSIVSIDIAAAKAAGFSLKNVDDLTIVEGIGPKINELLIESGVKTLAQLAELTVPQMRAILDKGGARFRIANPSTWAKQAKLASVNKWNELKKLQDELSGGVKK